MQAPEIRHYSVEEYFALDQVAPEGVRLEYDAGVIYLNGHVYDPAWGWEAGRALAGAAPEHNQLVANLMFVLMSQLRDRNCHVLSSDQRVTAGDLRYTYPDIVASCQPSYEGVQLTNPDLIVEVLSASSAERDLRQKLEQYQRIASLKEYWVISAAEVSVTRYYRTRQGWAVQSCVERDEVMHSEELHVEVALEDVYRGL